MKRMYCNMMSHHESGTRTSSCRFLEKAVAVILAFIGGKMILDEIPGGFHVSTEQSLLFVATALGTGVATSLLLPEESAASEGRVQNVQNGAGPAPIESQELEAKVEAQVEAQVKGKKDTA